MKHTGRIVRVDQKGKIIIPPSVLQQIGIESESPVEFTISNNNICVQKKVYTCLVTGAQTEDVKEVFPGIYLSKRGMEILGSEILKSDILGKVIGTEK